MFIRHSLETAALTLALAASASAQAIAPAVDPKDQQADQMHARALAMHANPDRLQEAARLHRFEAKLRKEGDKRAFDCLSLASYLLIYSGRLKDARYVMEQAAQEATKRGDVLQAAQAYVEAAFIAEKQKKYSDVIKLADRARELSRAPGMTVAQRDAILNRLSYPLAAASVRN